MAKQELYVYMYELDKETFKIKETKFKVIKALQRAITLEDGSIISPHDIIGYDRSYYGAEKLLDKLTSNCYSALIYNSDACIYSLKQLMQYEYLLIYKNLIERFDEDTEYLQNQIKVHEDAIKKHNERLDKQYDIGLKLQEFLSNEEE